MITLSKQLSYFIDVYYTCYTILGISVKCNGIRMTPCWPNMYLKRMNVRKVH
jgi:hypothetical protein